MRQSAWAMVPVLAVLFAAGCQSNGGDAQGGATAADAHECAACEGCPLMAIKEAVAAVEPTHGNKVRGVVRFVESADGVRITAEITGLTANAKHAFHIHEFGDCTSADGTSAGGHYNPEGHPHAGPDSAARHAGDLGNLEADAKGGAMYERFFAGLTIAGMHDPILGRSVVIHADVDDFTTQPSGKAGARVGCGVIGVAKAAAK